MKDFFVSYTGVDRTWAEWIAWQLEENGYQVVIQSWDFRPGGNFVLDMQKAVSECERTIAVLSPDFLRSKYVQPEWAAAFSKDPTGEFNNLLLVRVRECEVPGLLKQINYIDLVGEKEHAAIAVLLEGIKKAIGEMRGKPSEEPHFPGEASTRTISNLPIYPSTDSNHGEIEDIEEMLTYLPHPIAAPLYALRQMESEKEKFSTLDNLLKNTIHYFYVVALSQYWQEKPDKVKLYRWLTSVVEAQLLTTLHVLDDINFEYRSDKAKSVVYSALFDRLNALLPSGSSLEKVCEEIANLELTPPPKNITIRDFIERLLLHRQSNWESDPFQVDSSLRKRLLPLLQSAILELISLFAPLFRYKLCFIEHIDKSKSNWIYTMVEFPGAEGKASLARDSFVEQHVSKPSFKPLRLYLCSPVNLRPLVSLHPFLIVSLFEIYFLEALDANKSFIYKHCSSPKRYFPPEYYRYLSTSLSQGEGNSPYESDIVETLVCVNEELENDELVRHVEKTPLPVLLSYLDNNARLAFEFGIGESRRVGQFWLGIEFVLMGMSRLENGILSKKLHEIGLDARTFRGVLRELVPIREKDWRTKQDIQALGTAQILTLHEIPNERLSEFYNTEKTEKNVITPRLSHILRDAVRNTNSDKISERNLLILIMAQTQLPSVNMLASLLALAQQDIHQWIWQLTKQELGSI